MPTTTDVPTTDENSADVNSADVLADEQAHLEASHAALARMRAESAEWSTATAGDSVSTAFLRQALYRRMESLENDPDTRSSSDGSTTRPRWARSTTRSSTSGVVMSPVRPAVTRW